MRKFVRQKANGGPPNVSMDFGAAESKVAKILEAGEYRLRLEAARVIERNQNILIALDLVEVESNQRVDSRPLWVDGPNSNAGNLTAENQHLVAQLPTAGNVGELIPKLGGLEFDARLVLAIDSRTQRTFNQITDVYTDNEANEAS
jgi:hypothetical protein